MRFTFIFLTFGIFIMNSALGQEEIHHSRSEIVYKEELTTDNIAIYDALINRENFSEKIKGNISEGKYSKTVKNMEKKVIYKEKGHINKAGEKVVHKNYVTGGVKLTYVNGSLENQHFAGFIPIDTLRKLKIATFEVDENDSTYYFTESFSFDRAFEKIELFIQYEGDENWVPIGRHGKNLEYLLAYDPIPFSRFKKYERRAIWGKRIVIFGLVAVLPLNYTIGTVAAGLTLVGCSTSGIIMVDRAEAHIPVSIAIYNSLLEQ